jgi:sortase B
MNKVVKTILYFFFTAVIVVSIFFVAKDYVSPKKNVVEEEEPISVIPIDPDTEVQIRVETDSTIKMAPDVDLNAERARFNNDDIIGRLEIPDLINVLIVRGSDNSYYLKHDLTKAYDYRGSEFMDFRLTPLSKQINIYGHNSRDVNSKVAFLKLEKFLDPDFFENNKYIIFQYDGGKSIYKIKVLKEIKESNTEHMNVNLTGEAFVKHFNNMTTNVTTGSGVIFSRDVPFSENSNIIVLQTCSHHWDNALYTLIGIKIN